MSEGGVQRGDVGAEKAVNIDRPSGRRRSDRIVGAGRATQELVDQALAVSRTERPVLLTGPPGSGKEHLARAIHDWSARRTGPFVVISCSAVSEGLARREIFGCSDGTHRALPGEYRGALARAAGGTLVIDGFDQLRADVRDSAVRAVQENRFAREGDAAEEPLRCRIIVSTTEESVADALGDLPVHALGIPPLADRREDILALAAHFLRIHADDAGVKPIGFTADARDALLNEEWPGNVRELSERIRQAIKLAGDGALTAEALLLGASGESVPSFREAKRAFETRYVEGLLRRCGGNISRAARLAKKDRKDFYDVIRRTGVDPSEFR